MKLYLRATRIAIMLTLSIISVSGCKKDHASKPDIFEVKYEVVPMNNYIINFTYNDETQKVVELNDPGQFSNGVKKINVDSKPFTAKLTIKINNTSLATVYGQLLISINGEVKKYRSFNAAPRITTEVTAEYIIR